MSGATTTLPTDQIQYVPGVSGPSPTAPISSVAIPQPAQQPPAQPQQPTQAPQPSVPQVTWPSIDTHLRGQTQSTQQQQPLQNLEPVSVDQIAQYFVQKGLTPQQARGIARAFMEESGGNPEAFNPAGGGIGAAGIAQWRADRQRRLVAQYGPSPTAQQQLDFAWQELNTTEKPAFDAVRQASTEESAYNAFRSKFERPGPPPGEMQAGATFPYQEFMRRSNETYQQESDELKRLMDEASKAPEGSQERHQMMQEAMESSRRLSNTFEQIATHPPTEKPIDMMQNFGSLATVIAIFGGLLAKRPLTAALGAAGTAMQAQNAGNHELFEKSYQQWHDQTQLVSQAIGFQNQEFQQILQDVRLSEEEKNAEIEKKLRLFGMQNTLDQWNVGNAEQVYKDLQTMQKAEADLKNTLAQADEHKARAQQIEQGGGIKVGKVSTLRVTQPDGTTKTYQAQQKPDGQWVTADERRTPIDVSHGFDIQPPSAGRQAETQLISIRGSGNEAVKALTNLVELPLGATAGSLMGVQYQTPDELREAIKRTIAQRLTPRQVRDLLISFQGVSRNLATLEAQGRAQGLVGLSNKMDALLPQVSDDPFTVLRIYAEIRQIIDATMENARASGQSSPDAQRLFDRIATQARAAVPWTVHDVTQLEYGGEEGTRDFARKVFAGRPEFQKQQDILNIPPEAINILSSDPTPQRRQQFDRKFGDGAAAAVLGQ